MEGLSERTRRRTRGIRASAVLGWLFVLLAMVSCCSIAAPGAHGRATHQTTASQALTTVHLEPVRIVVAHAPEDRGAGSSCHGSSEHATPVILPTPSAPMALPCAIATAPVAPLTGAAVIRGPSNDAVHDVDRFRLQVQRI
ncbi:hypothetical protein ACFVWY_15820 [Streptomyces sp. NPDC058195]|uniref:hypothetical protein n=1 Tax=Streptomyces sp. NPDC058195 TaxID=3346375 RepID=UPI0036E9D81A